MRIEPDKIHSLITIINQVSDSKSQYYGKLVTWEDDNNLHYGIGLSDTQVFDTGEDYKIKTVNINPLNSQQKNPFNKFIRPFNEDDTIKRLKHALYCCNYLLFDETDWNDEHLARLIATNRPESEKSGLLIVRTDVRAEFIQYLQKYAPNLNQDFFTKLLINQKVSRILWLSILATVVVVLFGIAIPRLFESGLSFIFLALTIFFVIIICRLLLQLYNWEWSGFKEKRLWNWLDLLLVPILLAIGGFYLESRVEERQFAILQNNNKQEALRKYLEQIKDIVSDSSISNSIDKLGLYTRQELTIDKVEEKIEKIQKENQTVFVDLSPLDERIAESLTLTILGELDEDQKIQVIKLLSKLRLITLSNSSLINLDDCKAAYRVEPYPKTEISLSTANLKAIDTSEQVFNFFNFKGKKGLNLSRQDLRCVNFRGANLQNAIFDEADLRYADFRNTDLTGVSFKEANLEGTKFGTTTVIKSVKWGDQLEISDEDSNEEKKRKLILSFLIDYEKEKKPELIKNLTDNLQKILGRKNLLGINLSGANLSNVNLSNANLSTADLTNANLSNTNLSETNLTKANLSNANLNEADLTKANLANANLSEADLSNADLTDANLTDAILDETIILPNTKITMTQITKVKIPSIRFKEDKNLKFNFHKTDFFGINLQGANFSGINLQGANFSGINLFEAQLQNTQLQNAQLQNANLNSADLTGADLTNADLTSANLIATNLTNATLAGNKLNLTNACYDESTQFPDKFDPEQKGLKKITPPEKCPLDK